MEVPEAKEYLAVLVDSKGRVLLRNGPGVAGGYFIRSEPSGGKSPDGSIIESVFDESGLTVKVVSVGEGVYFGGRGVCGYFIVELVGSGGTIASDEFLVNWYDIEEAVSLISRLRNDSDFQMEMAVLGVASDLVKSRGFLRCDRLTGLASVLGFEDFQMVCTDVERIFSGGKGDFLGLGINSDLVVELLNKTKKRIECGEIGSEYERNIISRLEKKIASKEREGYLLEVISICTTRAYGFLLDSDSVSCKKACLIAKKHIEMYDILYPNEGRARRERAVKGGKRKAERREEREGLIYQTIIDVLQENAPYRSRLEPRFIVAKVLEDILGRLLQRGVKSDRDDIEGCVIDLLSNDGVAKKIIGRL